MRSRSCRSRPRWSSMAARSRRPSGARRRRAQAVARSGGRSGAARAGAERCHFHARGGRPAARRQGLSQHNAFKIDLARRAIVRALTQAAHGTPQSQSNKKIGERCGVRPPRERRSDGERYQPPHCPGGAAAVGAIGWSSIADADDARGLARSCAGKSSEQANDTLHRHPHIPRRRPRQGHRRGEVRRRVQRTRPRFGPASRMPASSHPPSPRAASRASTRARRCASTA